jgi:hypothetical protein
MLALALLSVADSSPARQAPSPANEPRPTGTGAIRGRVVDPVRGTPVPRVTVTATFWRRVPPGSSAGQSAPEMLSRPVTFSARTSADGSFAIASLPPGEFNLAVQRDGYGGRNIFRSRQVTVAAGATVVVADFALAGGGVITGRVLDACGDPVIRATVTPFSRRFSEPGQPLVPMGSPVQTDDRGRYRLFNLPPASYTVHAVPRPWRRGTPQGDPRELLPGVAGGRQFTDAEFVDVAAGEEATLDVRLDEGVLGSVAGGVSTATGEAVPGVTISLRPADPNIRYHVAGGRSASTGAFELSGVPPGRYLVVAEAPPSAITRDSVRPRAAWTVVSVAGHRVDGVSLVLSSGGTVRGRVDLDGADPAALRERQWSLAARPATSGWLPAGHVEATLDQEALTFELEELQGPHRIVVTGLPGGWWVKAITIDGRDVWDGHDFPSRGVIESAVVVLSGRPTGVTGRVEKLPSRSGDAGPARAVVLVVPHDVPSVDAALRGSGHITGVAADGTFRAEGVRPGTYDVLVVAADMMETVRDMTPEQVRALVDAHGATVDVVEGQFTPVTVRMVPQIE